MKYTKEDLMNTWGVVESKEHAAFIAELAKNAGFNCTEKYKGHFSFAFYPSGNFSFHQIEIGELNTDKLKQITIPLPPKEKEWPCEGDKVEFPTGKGVLVVSKPDEQGIVIVESLDDELGSVYKRVSLKAIEKPKSAQDLKIEELHAKLCEFNTVDNYILACDIVHGKIEGLSYEQVG